MGRRSRRRVRFGGADHAEWSTADRELGRSLAAQLEAKVASLWCRGWQPVDLARALHRRMPPEADRLLAAVVVSEARAYRHLAGADPRWLRQVEGLEAGQRFPVGADVVRAWARHERLGAGRAICGATGLLACLDRLPDLPRLCAPPAEWGTRPAPRRTGGGGADPKILARVRALLAKAESTSFVAEAEALTAKAQELMSRHAIDLAMVEASAESEPEGRRIGIDDPYAWAKSTLLGVIAQANRCRAVSSLHFGFSTVFGYGSDLEVVELLFTSLLVQATRAMTAEGKIDERRRRRAFRQSFLVGFAVRIGERLDEASRAAADDAGTRHGPALVPVLRARAEAVDEAFQRAFAKVVMRDIRVSDHDGWIAGIVTADRADLAAGPKVSRPSVPLPPRAG